MSTPRQARTLELLNTSAGDGTALVPRDVSRDIGSHSPSTSISTLDAVNPGVIGTLDATIHTAAFLGEIAGDMLARFDWEVTQAANAGTTARVNAVLFLDDDPAQEIARVEGAERAADALATFNEREASELVFPRDTLEAGTPITFRLELEVVTANGGGFTVAIHHDPTGQRALLFMRFGELDCAAGGQQAL